MDNDEETLVTAALLYQFLGLSIAGANGLDAAVFCLGDGRLTLSGAIVALWLHDLMEDAQVKINHLLLFFCLAFKVIESFELFPSGLMLHFYEIAVAVIVIAGLYHITGMAL